MKKLANIHPGDVLIEEFLKPMKISGKKININRDGIYRGMYILRIIQDNKIVLIKKIIIE